MALDKSDLTSKPTKPIQKRANEPSGMWQRRRHPAYVLRSVPWSHWRQGIKKFGVYFREKPSSERWKGSFKTALEIISQIYQNFQKREQYLSLGYESFLRACHFSKRISCRNYCMRSNKGDWNSWKTDQKSRATPWRVRTAQFVATYNFTTFWFILDGQLLRKKSIYVRSISICFKKIKFKQSQKYVSEISDWNQGREPTWEFSRIFKKRNAWAH